MNGDRHWANSIPLRIPKALSPVVEGVLGIHDFLPVPVAHRRSVPHYGTADHYLLPSDYSTIYDISPLYSQGTDGSGQTIAIVGRCAIDTSIVQTFRSLTGLPANNTSMVPAGQLPPPCTSDNLLEPYLDVEWSGAVAKNANIVLVVATNIGTAASYIVNNNLAPVMSTSFSSCEAEGLGGSNQYWLNLWEQASSHGITSLVSSGDSGAAGCDTPDSTTATHGPNVNAICSTPYDICVGGTELNDFSNPAQFWSPQGNALGYIPEEAWNESGSGGLLGGLWSTGGGYSVVYPITQAPWQTGNSTSWRGVPDISLPAANHDGYFICLSSGCNLNRFEYAYGTSAASPSFAGLMALLVQNTGSRQGAANSLLYALAPHNGVFHDIVQGNNAVPGQNGYAAGPGWDPVTGLGSVDANLMVANWGSTSTTAPSVLLSSSALTFGNQVVGTTSASQTVTVTNDGNAPLNITAVNLQGTNTADFPSTTTCPPPGTLAAGQNCVITITFAPSDTGTRTASIAISDNAANSPQTVALLGTGLSSSTPPTVVTALTSNSDGIVNNNCSTPPQVTSFSVTAPAVWLYFDVNGVNIGDIFQTSFVRPDGIVDQMLSSTSTYSGGECFSYYLDIVGYDPASYPGTWTIQTFWNQSTTPLFTLNFTIGSSNTPAIAMSGGVVNGAGFQPGVPSGSWFTVKGTNLASTTDTWGSTIVNGVLPTKLDGVSVMVGNQAAYIAYISPTQINAVAPNVPSGTMPVTVMNSNGTSQAVNAEVQAEQPAFFQWGSYAVATRLDYSLAVKNGTFPGTTTVPAKPGDVIILWGTGFGPTNPSAPAGVETPSTNTYNTANTVSVTVGPAAATVYGAALAPGYAGLYQVAIQIPKSFADGDYPVVATVSGAQSPSTTMITVQH